jgi:hypothetical protein
MHTKRTAVSRADALRRVQLAVRHFAAWRGLWVGGRTAATSS